MNSQKLQINQIKDHLAATLCAIVADEELQVEFVDGVVDNFFVWDQNLVSSKKRVLLPQIDVLKYQEDVVGIRAAGDMAACYLLFHDASNQLPNDFSLEEIRISDGFERIRVLANIAFEYRGVVQNILVKIEDDIFIGSSSLSLILLQCIFAGDIGSQTAEMAGDLKNSTPNNIVEAIEKLVVLIGDQKKFCTAIHDIIEMLRREQDELEEEFPKSNDDNSEKNKSETEEPANINEENIDANEDKKSDSALNEGEQKSDRKQDPDLSDFIEDDLDADDLVKSNNSDSGGDGIEFKNPYKVFTSKFDEVVFPQKMVSKNDLEMLRDQLDLKMSKLQGISKKMTLKMKRKLLSKRNSFVEHDSSRGIFDRKKMTQLVLNPMIEDIWVDTKTHEYQDTALTILLDNSGSMRGGPIVMTALACEIIADILEKFSVKTEIIGFTTSDWKGGRARKLWESSGTPENPGRLNELRHVIYKHFNQSFKRSKVNLGMMLKEGVLKENIDGEALLFARSRLLQQSEKRKILMVISDGTPVDDSTTSANDSDLLTDHLHHVINKIEKSSQIEIVGVGIGHTTDDFYRNSIAIKNLDELGDVMIEKIADLL